MTLEEFNNRCDETAQCIKRAYERTGGTHGLCCYIDLEIDAGPDSAVVDYFSDNFRCLSPYPMKSFWLGKLHSEEGYKNRLEFLEMFRKKAIEDKAYEVWL